MSRRARLTITAVAVLAFIVISGLLARYLSVENVERDDILALLRSQVRGDVPGMLGKLHGCAAACQAAVRADAARLHGNGPVQILNRKSPTAYSLGGATGTTRIAWRQPGRLPVVQCVVVRRTGNALTGLSVRLLSLSTPIPGTADC